MTRWSLPTSLSGRLREVGLVVCLGGRLAWRGGRLVTVGLVVFLQLVARHGRYATLYEMQAGRYR